MTVHVHPVTGPPGAGKTTALVSLDREHRSLARFAVREYGLALAESGHPLGLRLRDPLLRGHLLADDLVRQEFAHFLGQLPDEVEAVAVEGYPRDRAQCADLVAEVAAAGGRLAELILVDVPDEVVFARVAARRICTSCGLPVLAATGGCPCCGGPVARREDDAADRLDQRLRDFRTISSEVRSYFAERGLLRLVDGLQSPERIRASLATLLLGSRHREATR